MRNRHLGTHQVETISKQTKSANVARSVHLAYDIFTVNWLLTAVDAAATNTMTVQWQQLELAECVDRRSNRVAFATISLKWWSSLKLFRTIITTEILCCVWTDHFVGFTNCINQSLVFRIEHDGSRLQLLNVLGNTHQYGVLGRPEWNVAFVENIAQLLNLLTNFVQPLLLSQISLLSSPSRISHFGNIRFALLYGWCFVEQCTSSTTIGWTIVVVVIVPASFF